MERRHHHRAVGPRPRAAARSTWIIAPVLAMLLSACAAPDAEGPPPLDDDTRSELENVECQLRARNRPDEAQRMAECNHPRIGG